MLTYAICEDLNRGGYYVTAASEGLPPHWQSETYPSVDAAKAAHPHAWQEPDGEMGGDVVAIAEERTAIDNGAVPCFEGPYTLDDLLDAIAAGRHDIDYEDFPTRLGLGDDWDWSDVNWLLGNGSLTLEQVHEAIHAGLR